MSGRSLRRAVIAMALMTVTREARAQGARDAAGAEALFKLGRDALAQGNVDEACDRFHASYRLDPAGGTLLNIGACEERREHLAAAWEAFSEAVAKLPVDDPRTPRARARIAELDRRLPRLVVLRPRAAPPDTRVMRDDIELHDGSFGVPLPLDAGVHRVRVVAQGHVDREIEVRLDEGRTSTVIAETGPRAATAVASVEQPPRPSNAGGMRPAATVALVTGGVLAIAGATFGAMTYEAGQRVGDQCNADNVCSASGLGAVEDARRWGTFSTVTIVSAGVAVAAGLVIQLLHL